MAVADGPVAILGYGTMGAGIALACARSGLDVMVLEADSNRLEHGHARVSAFLDEAVRRGDLDAGTRAAALGRLRETTDPAQLASATCVIEAVVEDEETKTAILGVVGVTVRPQTVIATNTSAISVTRLARAVPDPGRFAGLHFFNPAPVMPLVEVVRALETTDETIEALRALALRLGKHPIIVKDRPGFLVNYLHMPYLNHALREFDAALASAADIDTAVELGLGYPNGPLKTLDLVGLDTHLLGTQAVFEATGDARFAPPPLLRQLVDAGRYGRKTGRGLVTGGTA